MRSFPFLLALLLLATARTGAATASPDPPLYLALGDSLAAGVGASEPAQTGYVGLVFDPLRTEPASPYAADGLATRPGHCTSGSS